MVLREGAIIVCAEEGDGGGRIESTSPQREQGRGAQRHAQNKGVSILRLAERDPIIDRPLQNAGQGKTSHKH